MMATTGKRWKGIEMDASAEDDVVIYQVTAGVAVVTMNRPDYRNAQNSLTTYALDAAFQPPADDDAVNVIVLAGAGQPSAPATTSVPPPATTT